MKAKVQKRKRNRNKSIKFLAPGCDNSRAYVPEVRTITVLHFFVSSQLYHVAVGTRYSCSQCTCWNHMTSKLSKYSKPWIRHLDTFLHETWLDWWYGIRVGCKYTLFMQLCSFCPTNFMQLCSFCPNSYFHVTEWMRFSKLCLCSLYLTKYTLYGS